MLHSLDKPSRWRKSTPAETVVRSKCYVIAIYTLFRIPTSSVSPARADPAACGALCPGYRRPFVDGGPAGLRTCACSPAPGEQAGPAEPTPPSYRDFPDPPQAMLLSAS